MTIKGSEANATSSVDAEDPEPNRAVTINEAHLEEDGDEELTATQKRQNMFVATSSQLRSSNLRLFEKSYHPGVFSLYNPPRQRQRWGEKRVLPRINWGDLFFDLFYVAATYNISYILVTDPSGLGFLYFIATFIAVYYLWNGRTFYDSTFVVEDDLFHRLSEIIFLSALASAIVHTRTVEILSHPSDYVDMFALSLSLLVGHVIHLIRQVEIGWTGVGQREVLKQVSIRNIGDVMIVLSLQLAATILAGLDYYRNSDADGYHRFLAGGAGGATNHLPIILTLAGPAIYQIVWIVRGIFFFPSDGSHIKKIVPMNVDFVLHRVAEWTMLMLGESVFSLLVEDVSESEDFYVTFYCALITVIFIQYIHFKSQPMVAERHVLVDSKNRALVSGLVQQLYFASLVGLGAAFTLFLKTFSKSGDGRRRWLSSFVMEARWLAGGGDPLYPPEELKERAAHVFSISLGLILFTLEILTFLHVGFEGALKTLRSKTGGAKYLLAFVVLMRLVVIVCVFLISQFSSYPNILAGVGLGFVLLDSILFSLAASLTKDENEEGGHH